MLELLLNSNNFSTVINEPDHILAVVNETNIKVYIYGDRTYVKYEGITTCDEIDLLSAALCEISTIRIMLS